MSDRKLCIPSFLKKVFKTKTSTSDTSKEDAMLGESKLKRSLSRKKSVNSVKFSESTTHHRTKHSMGYASEFTDMLGESQESASELFNTNWGSKMKSFDAKRHSWVAKKGTCNTFSRASLDYSVMQSDSKKRFTIAFDDLIAKHSDYQYTTIQLTLTPEILRDCN